MCGWASMPTSTRVSEPAATAAPGRRHHGWCATRSRSIDGVSVLASVFIKPCFTTLKGEWRRGARRQPVLASALDRAGRRQPHHRTRSATSTTSHSWAQREAVRRSACSAEGHDVHDVGVLAVAAAAAGRPADARRRPHGRDARASTPPHRWTSARDYRCWFRVVRSRAGPGSVAGVRGGVHRRARIARQPRGSGAIGEDRVARHPCSTCSRTGPDPTRTSKGGTGINGHEICYQPRPGVEFTNDPHCTQQVLPDLGLHPAADAAARATSESIIPSDLPCIWTDMDCDACTGSRRQGDGGAVVRAGPRAAAAEVPLGAGRPARVTVEWDNPRRRSSAAADVMPGFPWTFWGYRVYRLDQWDREFPAAARRALAAARELRRGHDTPVPGRCRGAGPSGGPTTRSPTSARTTPWPVPVRGHRVQNGFGLSLRGHCRGRSADRHHGHAARRTCSRARSAPCSAGSCARVPRPACRTATARCGWCRTRSGRTPRGIAAPVPGDVHAARGLHGAATRAVEDPHLHAGGRPGADDHARRAAATASTRGT